MATTVMPGSPRRNSAAAYQCRGWKPASVAPRATSTPMARSAGISTGFAASMSAALVRARVYRFASTAMLLKILYWLAVVAISLALVVGLVLFLESRDQSSLESGALLLTRA